MQYHNILFSTAGGIRKPTHHVNVAHATRGQQNNKYLPTYIGVKRLLRYFYNMIGKLEFKSAV